MRHFILLIALPTLLAADWLQFRGSENNPVAAHSTLPATFGPDENVAWKVAVPGEGVSGPIVVGNRIFVTASSGAVVQDRLHVLCFDAASGQELWHRQLWATGRPHHHPTSANAAPTPASDGQRVFAFYSSNDLACFDLEGNLLWYRGLGHDYPKAGNDVGMSSSPLVVGDTVVVQVESQGDSFAAGIDAATGENRWRLARAKAPNWVSPAVLRSDDGKVVVLLQAAGGLTAHDPKSGEQLWKFDARCESIASVMAAAGRIFVPAAGLTALDVASAASSPSLAWESKKLALFSASPVVHDGRVYGVDNVGVLACGDAATGKILWELRLKGTFWATPLIAGERLYAVNQDGEAFVVRLGAKGELLHTVNMGEGFYASPAADAGGLYLRGEKHLWKIAE